MSLSGFLKSSRDRIPRRTKVGDPKKHENEDENENEPRGTRKINRSLLELHKPQGTPEIQILFFHGLQPEDSSGMPLSTWKCGDGSYWPQTWLVDEFPNAHVLSVSYNYGNSIYSDDFFMVSEDLISDFMEAGIGQIPDCPVVLVAHSFGSLAIKQLCVWAGMDLRSTDNVTRDKVRSFLNNLRGIFYFAPPQYGSRLLQQIKETQANPELEYFQTLHETAEWLNSDFEHLSRNHDRYWRISGLKESAPTNLGYSEDDVMVSARGEKFDIVSGADDYISQPERETAAASSKPKVTAVAKGSDLFAYLSQDDVSTREAKFDIVSGVDHYSICQPESKTAATFSKVKTFIGDIAREVAQERNRKASMVHARAGRGNLQDVPKTLVGIELLLEQVRHKLETVQSESLPDSFVRLSTLKELELSECENKRSLIPYGKMELEYLTINGERDELKMDRLSDSMAGLTPPKDLVTMAPQSTAIDLLPDPLHSTCKGSVEEPGSHLLNATEELSELVEEFMAEIKKVDQGGFLVSAEWLHNLEQHEKEVLMSVLWGAGFSEVYHTSTNILYKRLDQNDADISNPDLCNDASCAGCISDPTRLRTKPAQEEMEEEIQSSIVDTDRKANKDSNLNSPKGKEKLTVPTEQLSTSMRSFIAALKERGPRTYFVSTDWLSQLEHNELEMLKSICSENGFVETHRTSSTAYYERIEDNVSTSNDGSTRSRDSDDAGRPVDTATSGEDKKPSDSHPQDQRSFKIENEDDMPGALPTTGATQPRQKSDGTGCVEQLLEVTCTPCPVTPTEASTSSQNLPPAPRDYVIQSCGDSYVTRPILAEDKSIATKVEKTYIVQQYQYRKANELIEENVSLQISAETIVRCCVRSDNNEQKVRLKFLQLKGQIKHVEGPDILDLVLESVRTNVGAGIYDNDNCKGLIVPDLKDPTSRSQEEVCLAKCGEGPTSAPPGTVNFELRRDGPTRTSTRWCLTFHDTESPVTIEGGIPLIFSDGMSLKLFVEYQLVVYYTKPCGYTVKPFVRSIPVRPEIDLGCTLIYRARSP